MQHNQIVHMDDVIFTLIVFASENIIEWTLPVGFRATPERKLSPPHFIILLFHVDLLIFLAPTFIYNISNICFLSLTPSPYLSLSLSLVELHRVSRSLKPLLMARLCPNRTNWPPTGRQLTSMCVTPTEPQTDHLGRLAGPSYLRRMSGVQSTSDRQFLNDCDSISIDILLCNCCTITV